MCNGGHGGLVFFVLVKVLVNNQHFDPIDNFALTSPPCKGNRVGVPEF